MKFMFFNLMAVIAILYLVAVDGSPTSRLPDFLTSVGSKGDAKNGAELAERAHKKLANFKAMVEKVEVSVQNPVPEFAPPQKPIEIVARPVNKVPVHQANKPKFKPIAQKSTLKLVEAVAPLPAQKFMSRAERQRELNRLAHDMEMMFADKFSE
jgi:hypothetical protein